MEEWEIDADAMAKHKFFQACIGSYQLSTEMPEVARGCLQAILRAAVAHRRGMTTKCKHSEVANVTNTAFKQRKMENRHRDDAHNLT